MRKEVVLVITVFMLIYALHSVRAALSVSPAVFEINYEPGYEGFFRLYAEDDDPEKKLEIYAIEDFAEYVTFDKTEMTGGGGFRAYLSLPAETELKGKRRLLIGVREKPDDKTTSMVSTLVAIQIPIYVNVPYPGKYAKAGVSVPDVNEKEPIILHASIENLGNEEIDVNMNVETFSGSNNVEKLFLGEKHLEVHEVYTFEKRLDNKIYVPGFYKAVASADYGGEDVATAETEFRVGRLFVNLTNYTKRFLVNKVNRFNIEATSLWNNNIDAIYGSIEIYDKKGNLKDTLKTPMGEVGPWRETNLVAFFDTTDYELGFYDAEITLHYYNATTVKSVEIEVYKEQNKALMFIVLVAVISFAVILLIFAIFLYKRNKKEDKKTTNKRKK